ncbi:ABC transporter substrate-binding protein [Streptomyces djakartensis]|uniref:ABC transporter substrate-binding protein n=1 Tax=Streptomyces djakartensis TaxID=68193 RepID=A0ABQ3A2F3_9ACTN|nr:ABC transporter substrate-binding protein [Streptomyces djakartensis]GGY33225.1 ABC transporter substrate-binding protein [Streptomyces djakartensis]
MKRRLAATLITAVLTLSACGSGGTADSTAKADGSGKVSVSVSAIAVAAAAPIEIAVREGYFADEGLDAKISYAEPAAMIPSVVSGQAQFAMLNAPAVLTARSNSVPAVAVAGISAPDPDPGKSYIQLLVGKDSKLRDPADLEGKTVAVDTLYQLPDLSLRHALRTEGVDPSKVKFVEIPFPQMADALKKGKVDAVNAAEPFVTSQLAAGARSLLSSTEGQDGTWPHTVMLTSEKYLGKNKDVVDRFNRAIAKADAYAQKNPDKVRALVPQFTQVPEQAAQKMLLPVFTASFEAKGWQAWADVLTKEKLAKGEIAADEGFYTP